MNEKGDIHRIAHGDRVHLLPTLDPAFYTETMSLCVHYGAVRCVAWLLQEDPQLAKIKGRVPLLLSCIIDSHEPHYRVAKLLLAAQANPNFVAYASPDDGQRTLLEVVDRDRLSAYGDHALLTRFARLLIKNGAAVGANCQGSTLVFAETWQKTRARARATRIALWLALRARGWPRDVTHAVMNAGMPRFKWRQWVDARMKMKRAQWE